MAVANLGGERRIKLLKAAQRAMAEHGTAVRLNQVAEEAGLTSGAILYHYPELQDLLTDATRAVSERFYEERLLASESVVDPAARLIMMVKSGLPLDVHDEGVKLLCALGGAAPRHPIYAVLLTSLYDRQVSLYQSILDTGAALGKFTLTSSALNISRNLVALEDAYGYRMMAGHSRINYDVAVELILDYARAVTNNPLLEDTSR